MDRNGLICSVYFESPDGRLCGHVTNASSLFQAVRNSWDWYQAKSWLGPRPTLDTIFSVTVSSRPDKYLVEARRAIAPQQAALFESMQEAFDPR